jgi:hypothetical protein
MYFFPFLTYMFEELKSQIIWISRWRTFIFLFLAQPQIPRKAFLWISTIEAGCFSLFTPYFISFPDPLRPYCSHP